jgi:glucosyl-3-phosphoglycerate synthase
MADFHQTGVIATFHRLGEAKLDKIEAELSWFAQERPIALILPSLFSELEGNALKRIISELKNIRYLKEVVVTLGPCTKKEFDHARRFFSVLPQTTKLIWNSGKRISDVYKTIEASGLKLGSEGKGQSAWMAYGYVISQRNISVIALHINGRCWPGSVILLQVPSLNTSSARAITAALQTGCMAE